MDQTPVVNSAVKLLVREKQMCKKYWNIEQLDMCIQKFTEGYIKFTCRLFILKFLPKAEYP